MESILPAEIMNYCRLNKIQFTPQQLIILNIFCKAENPLGASEVLARLEINNPKANRMTVHRALEMFIDYGLIHKINFNNTYALCQHISDHNCQLLVCKICASQIEMHSHELCKALAEATTKYNFIITNQIELTGVCNECRSLNNHVH